MRAGALIVALAVAAGGPREARAEFRQAAHPYILWTKAEAAAIRKKVESQDWAKAEYQRLGGLRGYGKTYANLFRYAVMGDEKAGEAERKYLLSFLGAPIGESRRHTQYLSALRYDVLYDTLTPEQRQQLEQTFRKHVQYQLDHPRHEDRLSWLPNMQWPRMLGAHLLAVALGDEKLLRAVWSSPNGMKWYFDEYLADGGLYFEEFGKIRSCVGVMLLFCRACDRLGLEEVGYGYVGKGGASMRSYVEGLIWTGYPRVELPTGLHHYPRVTMGDAKGAHCPGAPRFAFQHAIVPGAAGGDAERDAFFAANMNGRDHKDQKVEKLDLPHWFEILHAKYPQAGFDYFLAQMRQRGQAVYYPRLFWGLDPIDPRKVTPPPAPSRVFPERGFAMLRAEESPAYWQSPAPAVAVQFATLYVHYLPDCFSLLGYHAYHRPIYVNRTISAGYNGGPYDFSVRSHCGVVVDGLQAQPVGPVPSRHEFTPEVKFLAVRTPKLATPHYTGREVRSSDQTKVPATHVYPGVQLERALLLTREYLFDAFSVRDEAGKPRSYHWLVHALGEARPDDPAKWKPDGELQKTLFNTPEIRIPEARRMECGPEGWSLSAVQTCALADVDRSVLGRAWYDRKVGVRVSMLGEPGSTAFWYRPPLCYTPGSPRAPKADQRAEYEAPAEVGGVSVVAARTCPATTFVALHEPFEGGRHRIGQFRRVAQTDRAVAVAIAGADGAIDDRAMVRFGDDPERPVTLAGGGESFTFADYAWVRIGRDQVEARGGLRAMTLRVTGRPKLVLNGKPAPAAFDGEFLLLR